MWCYRFALTRRSVQSHVEIIVPANEDHLKAYVTITIDDYFLITGLKLIRVSKGYYVEMPRTKRANGKYVDIAAPLNNETRQMIQDRVVAEYERIAGEAVTRRKLET
jgi:DNA-binding cell septation regulator SpoVG